MTGVGGGGPVDAASPYARATALLRDGRGAEAVAVMEAALRRNPEAAEVRARLALVCWEADRFDEALGHAEAALRVDPDNASALAARGLAAHSQHRPEDAVADLECALRIRPDFVAAHVYAGLSYGMLGQDDRALAALDRALFLQPAHPNARFSRALQWLRRGWFDRGWPEYEWRWATGQLSRPDIPRPRWDGSPLEGRRILVHAEQGIGDTFQFVRLLPALRDQGASVVFACLASLRPLLERTPGIDDWFPIDEPAPAAFDCYTPIASLPFLLGIGADAGGSTVPYVFPDPDRVDRWAPQIAALPGLRVGVSWQGSPTFLGDAMRSVPLRHFAPVAAVPGVTLVALQKGPGEEQIAGVADAVPLTVLDGLDADGQTMMDTAAVMAHLDLVITSDTAIAHLAGALGVPVWVVLPVGADWRWLTDRADSPWYPTMRLFRQPAVRDWESVFLTVATALHERVAHGPAPAPEPRLVTATEAVSIPVAAGDLYDRITILRIKAERVGDPALHAMVERELTALDAASAGYPLDAEAAALVDELRVVNAALWDIEDAVRACEEAGDFGSEFVALARSVYRTNDLRSALKARLDVVLGSPLTEVKSYRTPAEPSM